MPSHYATIMGPVNESFLNRADRRKAQGLCVTCGKVKTIQGKSTCQRCIAKTTIKNKLAKAKGLWLPVTPVEEQIDPWIALATAVFNRAIKDLTAPVADKELDGRPTPNEKAQATLFLEGRVRDWRDSHEFWFSHLAEFIPREVLQRHVRKYLKGGVRKTAAQV